MMHNWRLILIVVAVIFVWRGCKWLLSEERKQLKQQKMPDWRLTNDNAPRG